MSKTIKKMKLLRKKHLLKNVIATEERQHDTINKKIYVTS